MKSAVITERIAVESEVETSDRVSSGICRGGSRRIARRAEERDGQPPTGRPAGASTRHGACSLEPAPAASRQMTQEITRRSSRRTATSADSKAAWANALSWGEFEGDWLGVGAAMLHPVESRWKNRSLSDLNFRLYSCGNLSWVAFISAKNH